MRRRTFIGALGVFSIGVALGGYSFMRSARFGVTPETAFASPHCRDGIFHNLVEVPDVGRKRNIYLSWLKFLLEPRPGTRPPFPVPSMRIDLHSLDRDGVVWLGHSSFLIRLGGKTILTDPVLSPYAAPVAFSNRAFAGSTPYTAADIPDANVVLISHDHWDHLDHPTMTALRDRIGCVVCPLGVGGHLRRWGFEKVIEGDWGDAFDLSGLGVALTPSQHFSGRTLVRNRTFWCGFAIRGGGRSIYFSGDGGYGAHFADIGSRLGPFDCALMECGQYNDAWAYIHMTPEQTARACADIRAAALIPMHFGKFSISYHAWDDPPRRVARASVGAPYRLLTPVIGAFTVPWEASECGEWWTRPGPA